MYYIAKNYLPLLQQIADLLKEIGLMETLPPPCSADEHVTARLSGRRIEKQNINIGELSCLKDVVDLFECVLKAYYFLQDILNTCWHSDGKQFMCCHKNGSLTTWNWKNAKPISVKFPHGNIPRLIHEVFIFFVMSCRFSAMAGVRLNIFPAEDEPSYISNMASQSGY